MNPLNVLLLGVLGFGCGCILAEICPPDWHRYKESCYFMLNNATNWYEANRTCAESQAFIAVPNSQSEQDYIWVLFRNAFDPMVPSAHLWIGCNDIEEEGKWQPCPLKGENESYENWRDGQPNGDNSLVDCAVMWYPNGLWHDRICKLDNYAVCELSDISETPLSRKQTGPDDRLTPQILLHHAMEELSDGRSCRSHPSCHSSYLPKQK